MGHREQKRGEAIRFPLSERDGSGWSAIVLRFSTEHDLIGRPLHAGTVRWPVL